jgi:hypothetical protein
MPEGVSENAHAVSSPSSPLVELTSADQITWTPDPANITDLANQVYWLVYQGTRF